MEGKADLHTHTHYSDGGLSPGELVRKAKSVGLNIIGITDHDSVRGLDEAIEHGRDLGVEVVPGIELSAIYNDIEIHILGYFIDHHSIVLQKTLEVLCAERLKRAGRIVDKLNNMKIPLTLESVLANATGEAVGRPHIANALVNEGHATSYRQAFSKYLGDKCPAYEQKVTFSPPEAIGLIAGCGGLSFLAHPGNSTDDILIGHLIQSGIDGVEVIHPSHSPELVKRYRSLVNEYRLLESGGSDFHGGMKGDDHNFGQLWLPIPAVDSMRERLA
jgi:3',5'-nucleoside bisphosphate phosphatase